MLQGRQTTLLLPFRPPRQPREPARIRIDALSILATEIIETDHARLKRCHEGAKDGNRRHEYGDGDQDLIDDDHGPTVKRNVVASGVLMQIRKLDPGCCDRAGQSLVQRVEFKGIVILTSTYRMRRLK